MNRKNSMKTSVSPKFGLCDEKIREEINSLIMARSWWKKYLMNEFFSTHLIN